MPSIRECELWRFYYLIIVNIIIIIHTCILVRYSCIFFQVHVSMHVNLSAYYEFLYYYYFYVCVLIMYANYVCVQHCMYASFRYIKTSKNNLTCKMHDIKIFTCQIILFQCIKNKVMIIIIINGSSEKFERHIKYMYEYFL